MYRPTVLSLIAISLFAVGAEAQDSNPFITDEANAAIEHLGKMLAESPTDPSASTVTPIGNGGYVVRTPAFEVVLSANGLVTSVEYPTSIQDPKSPPTSQQGGDIQALLASGELTVTPAGSPAPINPLEREAQRELDACIAEHQMAVEQASLMDSAAKIPSEDTSLGAIFLDRQLLLMGVKPENIDKERARFITFAKGQTSKAEAKYDAQWKAILLGGDPEDLPDPEPTTDKNPSTSPPPEPPKVSGSTGLEGTFRSTVETKPTPPKLENNPDGTVNWEASLKKK